MKLDLPKSQTYSVMVGHKGIRLLVLEGDAWVTRENDPEDHVVRAGDVFESKKRGRLVVMALSRARLEVTAPRKPVLAGTAYAHAASR